MLFFPSALKQAIGPSRRFFHASSKQLEKLNVEGLSKRVSLRGKNVLVRVDLNVPLAKVCRHVNVVAFSFLYISYCIFLILHISINTPIFTPQDETTVTDDTRLRAVVPTTKFLLNQGANVILCSHFGRPKGEIIETGKMGA